ncbi:MAG: 50S ribosomal protein L9 [Candidatus Komeilibacteria bacterium]|nr:50S ribosomal protein L9 [Candidatus Komeilibacteria bacterium]
MKVVLLRDYQALGKKDEIKEVKDGFALNFLIPQKIASKATTDRLVIALQNQAKEVKVAQNAVTSKAKQQAVLKTVHLTITSKANEQGHLYSQVSGKMIQDQLKKQFGISLSDASFKLVGPLKMLGEHVVQLRVENNLISIKVRIIHE